MRIAEAGHIYAEQLELCRQVRAGELGVPAEQPVGDHLRGGVTGRDQPIAAALDRRHLTDRINGRIACPVSDIGDHTAAVGHVETASAGQLVAGPHAGGEHEHRGVDGIAVGQRDPQPAGMVVDRGGRHPGMYGQTPCGDEVGQHRAAAFIDLKRHQPRRELHDMRGQTQQPQCIGGLETQQPTADHDPDGPGLAGLGRRPNRVEVIQCAVDEAAVQVVAGDRRTGTNRLPAPARRSRSPALAMS